MQVGDFPGNRTRVAPLTFGGAGGWSRTHTAFRLEDFKPKRKGRRINVSAGPT